jgi:hypothetical protein
MGGNPRAVKTPVAVFLFAPASLSLNTLRVSDGKSKLLQQVTFWGFHQIHKYPTVNIPIVK